MPTRKPIRINDDDYFPDAKELWHLDRFYADLATVGSSLTSGQKKYLRGLLLGHSLTEIAEKLKVVPGRARVALSNSVYRAVRALVGEETEVNSRTLRQLFSERGYAKKVQTNDTFSNENPYLSIALNLLLDKGNLIVHVNGRHREHFQDKSKALTDVISELIRNGRLNVVLTIEAPSNPANLNDQELSLLNMDRGMTNFVGNVEPSTQTNEIESLLHTIVKREITWFFQALFNEARANLENSSSSASTRDIICPYSIQHRDSIIQAFFSSARVLLYVKGWERIEHAARAEVEHILTPLLHKTSKVIFEVRPVYSLSYLMTPYTHVFYDMERDSFPPDLLPDLSSLPQPGSMEYFSRTNPELFKKYYGEDDFETGLYEE